VYGYAAMKTLTELSGTLIRTAAAAIAEVRRTLPKDEKPAEAKAPTPPAAPEAPQAETAAATAETDAAAPATAETDAAAPATAEPAAEAAAPVASKKADEAGESEAVKAALDAAVAKATGLSGDRLGMLRAAVEAAGRRAADVRLVRVFGPEEPVSGATAIGGHQYVVDYFPASMKQVAGGSREERGGRRGGRGGPGGGGGRGGGGGKGTATTGGFSMDSLREDRKNERGGRGRPSGPRRPAGAPKK
jgi:hypothetical protein